MTKISLIGAGSVVFAKRLLGDILQFPELTDVEICLMDIDTARLKVARIMAERMVAKLRLKTKISATDNQREAVRNARYVICTIQVGGYRPGTVLDFEIPSKYGLKQTIADTLGIGGIFRGLRTIPVIENIARDIADVGADGCLLLNYTNPMAMNCWAVHRSVGIPHVGLCHSVQGTSKQLAEFAGLPYEDISFLVAGINHMAFFLKFQYRGQDAYPLLFKALQDPERRQELVRFEMMRRTGYFVTESSEHQSEYLPYFIPHGKKLIDKFEIPIDEYLRRCEIITSVWESTEKELLGEDGSIAIEPQSHEYGSYIIYARETNRPTVIYGNVPNRGLITNLPNECCVEVPCLVNAQGIQPTHVGALPPQLAALCQTNIQVQELTVEAALTRKREHIYHAAMLDPNTAATLPLDDIWAMCDDLIEAHQKVGLLGHFEPVISGTGRSSQGIEDRIIARLDHNRSLQTAKGEKNQVTLHVENPTSRKIVAELEIRTKSSEVSLPGKSRLRVSVPAGESRTQEISLKNLQDLTESIHLELDTTSKSILAIGTTLLQRKRLTPDSKGVISTPLLLAGVSAGHVQIRKLSSGIEFEFHVEDSNVKVHSPNRPQHGSHIRLDLAANGRSKIVPFFLTPKTKTTKPTIQNAHLRPATSIPPRYKATAAAYTMTTLLPWKVLGVPPKTSQFLFDVAIRLQAHGDAHSGGLTRLSGQNGCNLASFLEVDFDA